VSFQEVVGSAGILNADVANRRAIRIARALTDRSVIRPLAAIAATERAEGAPSLRVA
jgi:hypothetical protein